MTFKEKITDLIPRQRVLMMESEKNLKTIELLEQELTEELKDHFEPFQVQVIANLQCGSASPYWEPCVFVYPFHLNGRSYVRIDGEWCWYSDYASSDVYAHKIIRKDPPPAPFNGKDLEALCVSLEAEFGIPFQIVESTLVEVEESALRTVDDLLAFFSNSKILASGEILSLGWDIPDFWVVLQTESGDIHVFYSTNGHGMGYDCHIRPGEDLSDFLSMMNQEGFRGSAAALAALSGHTP